MEMKAPKAKCKKHSVWPKAIAAAKAEVDLKKLEVKRVSTQNELGIAQKIGTKVFVEEQSIPIELELDEHDTAAIHVLAFVNGIPVATGRLRILPREEGNLSRIAVLPSHRGTGIGKVVVQKLETIARQLGLGRVYLSPHSYLEKFYTDLGYHKFGAKSKVGKHILIEMTKLI